MSTRQFRATIYLLVLNFWSLAGLAQVQEADRYIIEGDILFSDEYFEEAVSSYTQALYISPRSIVALTARASAYVALLEYQKAIDDFTAAISIDETYIPALLGRGWAYLLIAEHKRATEDFFANFEIGPRRFIDITDDSTPESRRR